MQLWNKEKTSVFANSWRRSRVILIEKHFQAVLQENNAYNPFSDESKAMVREMEQCRVIRAVRNNSKSAMLRMPSLLESRNSLVDISWLKANPAKIFTNDDWMLSQSRTTPSKRGDLVVLGKAKLRHRNSSFLGHNARRRCITKNFDEFHDRFQRDSVYRDSELKIGWTEEKSIEMDKLAQEDHSCCPTSEEYEKCKKNWHISLNKSGRNAPMKLRSDFREAATIMNRLHRESGEERPEPIPFHQYQRWHSSSSSSSTSWWQWNENWWSSFLFEFVVARLFTASGSLLQPTECVNRTPSHVTFSRVSLHS